MYDYSGTYELVINSDSEQSAEGIDALCNALTPATKTAHISLVAGDGVPIAKGDLSSKDLDVWDTFEDQLSYDSALEMKLPIAPVDASYSRTVLLRDVRWYTTVSNEESVCDYGVAVRLLVTVASTKFEAGLTLPIVSAKAQLNLLSATARLSVIGFRSPKVGDLLPQFSTMDVGAYGKYTESMDSIRKYISVHEDQVFPVLLRTHPQVIAGSEELAKAAGTSRGIRAVSDRRSLDSALREVPSDWSTYRSALTKAHKGFAPNVAAGDSPSRKDADAARRWVTWF